MPERHRRLVQSGTSVEGRIVDKTVDDSGDATTYTLHYEFALSGATVRHKMDVQKKAWAEARADERTTVLHDDTGRHSTLYRFGDYEVRA